VLIPIPESTILQANLPGFAKITRGLRCRKKLWAKYSRVTDYKWWYVLDYVATAADVFILSVKIGAGRTSPAIQMSLLMRPRFAADLPPPVYAEWRNIVIKLEEAFTARSGRPAYRLYEEILLVPK